MRSWSKIVSILLIFFVVIVISFSFDSIFNHQEVFIKNNPTNTSQNESSQIPISILLSTGYIDWGKNDSSTSNCQKIEKCNELICARICNKLTQFQQYTLEVKSEESDIESVISLISNENDVIIDRVDTSIMGCNPSDCTKFPLFFRNEGDYVISIIAKKGEKEEALTFEVNIEKVSEDTTKINFHEDQLKKYKLLIAINKDYFNSKDKDFIEEHSKELTNYINFIFSKNTRIRFDYVGVISYDDKSLKGSGETFNDNINKIGGEYLADRIILLWFNDFNAPSRPEAFIFGGTCFGKYISILGQKNMNLFDTPNNPNIQQDWGAVIHELGHSFSLGFPEQYFFEYYDCNPNKPKLNSFNILFEYPFDPMNKGTDINKNDYFFSDYNSAQLNNFLDNIDFNVITKNSYLKLVDSSEKPLTSVNISMYCVRMSGFFSSEQSCQIEDEFNFNKIHRDSRYSYTYNDRNPILTLTNEEGFLRIPFESGCIAYSIKAEKDSKFIGSYVNILDVRYAKLKYGQDFYIRGLVL